MEVKQNHSIEHDFISRYLVCSRHCVTIKILPIFSIIFLSKMPPFYIKYRQVSNIRRTLVGNKIVDNSDVVGASPVGAAPATYSLST